MRVSKDPEIRRQEIIDSARGLFKNKGIRKTSMNDVADNIGVAKGLIYYYFSSKDELVEAVVDEFIKDVDEELKNIMNSNLGFTQTLTAILDFYFNYIQSHLLVLTDSPGDPEILSLIRGKLSDAALFYARDLIELGVKLGIINIQYPEYILKIIIRGLGDLYIEGVTDPEIHARIIEQILGLEEGTLKLS